MAPHCRCCIGLDKVNEWAHEIEHKVRGSLDFAIDGGVVKVNALSLWPDLGVVGGREPRYAIVGNEGYVRARIIDSMGRRAWTQPVIVRR